MFYKYKIDSLNIKICNCQLDHDIICLTRLVQETNLLQSMGNGKFLYSPWPSIMYHVGVKNWWSLGFQKKNRMIGHYNEIHLCIQQDRTNLPFPFGLGYLVVFLSMGLAYLAPFFETHRVANINNINKHAVCWSFTILNSSSCQK
jgi:hypothetical protein